MGTPLAFDYLEKFDPIEKNADLSTSSFDRAISSFFESSNKADFSTENFLEQNPILKEISFAALLEHSSGLLPWGNFWINSTRDFSEKELLENGSNFLKSRSEFLKSRRELQERKLTYFLSKIKNSQTTNSLSREAFPPAIYSDLGFVLLGYLLEKLEKKPLDQLFYDFCEKNFLPKNLFFTPPKSKQSLCVPSVEFCPLRLRKIQGEVMDENTWALSGYSAHCGLFSSGNGFLEFLKKLLSLPLGQRILEENAKKIKKDNPSHTLFGWQQGDFDSSKGFCDGRTIGHFGFSGTSFLVCPKTGRYAILFFNKTLYERQPGWVFDLRKTSFDFFNQVLL